jgi:signal transduction histidine kinase
MYFRASERSKGNGLGLYIVKKAVEKLEGSITLSSVPGAGTTFTVMFPNNLMV